MESPNAVDRARKRAWLNRYRESRNRQERILEDIAELRGRSVGVVQSWNIRSGPTGSHSDHVADIAQKLDQLQRRLDAEAAHGIDIAYEIIHATFELSTNEANVLCSTFIDLLDDAAIAQKTGLKKSSISAIRARAITRLVIPEDAESDIESCVQNPKCGK